MKKSILFAAAGILLASCSTDDKGSVTIQLPENFSENTIVVSHLTIKNMFEATKAEDLTVIYDTLDVKDGVAELRLDPAGPARYSIEPPVMATIQPEFYAQPNEALTVTVKSFNPLDYEVKGTKLMEDIMAYHALVNPIQEEYMALVSRSSDVASEELQEKMKEYFNRKDDAIKKFVEDNPNSTAIPYVITDLSGDDFKKYYDAMTPEAKKSILMPWADAYNKDVEQMIADRDEEEARKAEVASGKIEAPGFTLPDLNGKMVSLSDFKGKWVVLDFWGSWCGWCVKGFPALKEAYEKYSDKLVIIGIDCNESETEWREGVKKHELPWINVYNGNDQALYQAYNITGFPTKAIINPEGRLVNLTTGEDPAFFTALADFLK
ncbi:MAG: TlpA family protein disulfide reductase [Muribaculaceae bacterium]|nr:TlpA family protein disulfide reductase [Muribaculaceae bacterium]